LHKIDGNNLRIASYATEHLISTKVIISPILRATSTGCSDGLFIVLSLKDIIVIFYNDLYKDLVNYTIIFLT
jgi:hypothetical protein